MPARGGGEAGGLPWGPRTRGLLLPELHDGRILRPQSLYCLNPQHPGCFWNVPDPSCAFQGLLISLGNISLPETCTQGIQRELPSHKEAGDGESLPLAPSPLRCPFHGQPVSEATRCCLCGCLVFSPPLFKRHCCTGTTSPPTPTPPPMTLGKAKALIPGK